MRSEGQEENESLAKDFFFNSMLQISFSLSTGRKKNRIKKMKSSRKASY